MNRANVLQQRSTTTQTAIQYGVHISVFLYLPLNFLLENTCICLCITIVLQICVYIFKNAKNEDHYGNLNYIEIISTKFATLILVGKIVILFWISLTRTHTHLLKKEILNLVRQFKIKIAVSSKCIYIYIC